jgi:uncharacterized coiled-coil protein SlyX
MKILQGVLGINELQEKINQLEAKVDAQDQLLVAMVEAVRNHSRAIVIITDDFKQLLESIKSANKNTRYKKVDDIYH